MDSHKGGEEQEVDRVMTDGRGMGERVTERRRTDRGRSQWGNGREESEVDRRTSTPRTASPPGGYSAEPSSQGNHVVRRRLPLVPGHSRYQPVDILSPPPSSPTAVV